MPYKRHRTTPIYHYALVRTQNNTDAYHYALEGHRITLMHIITP
jgi:hypothetical protein